MARRSGFSGLLTAMARESARQQRAAAAAARQAARNAAAWERDTRRAQTATDKEERKRYLDSRSAEVEELNSDLRARLEELRGILEHTLTIDDTIAFDSLRITEEYSPFAPPEELRSPAPQPSHEDIVGRVEAPRGLGAMLPGAKKRHLQALRRAQDQLTAALSRWQTAEQQRSARLETHRAEHEGARAAFERKKEQRNGEVAALEDAYRRGEPEAIVAYNAMVLERSNYPDGFPQEFRLAYVPESKQLVAEYEIPPATIIPRTSAYGYLKTRDEVKETPRKAPEIKDIYQDVVSAVCLRTIHELFEADQGHHIAVVCFNGFIHTVDPATGKDTRPHLISVRASRDAFDCLDLSRVDKLVCLRNLGAQVSSRPAEAQPIRPVVDFDMVDKRFVEQSDVLSDLDSRPNLIDLNPFEFEHLVANLFSKMGLDSKLTRSSRDGGVDCVAFDPRPVLGGKVVIQAKRYTNTVGVSAVRDLYGTMMNEGANKGILVTTSGYGPDAYQFCKDKPIELIDGGGLLYLLQQVGIAARIVFPDDGGPTRP